MADAGADGLQGGAVGQILLIDQQITLGDLSQAGDHLGELLLSVAGNARDAQNLALMDREGDALQRRQSLLVAGVDVVQLQDGIPGRHRRLVQAEEHLAPHHQPGQFAGAGLPGLLDGDEAPLA